jgi:hypothetical protein
VTDLVASLTLLHNHSTYKFEQSEVERGHRQYHSYQMTLGSNAFPPLVSDEVDTNRHLGDLRGAVRVEMRKTIYPSDS